MHHCRGHQVLAEAEIPKDKHGRPLPGFFPYLRKPTPDDDD